MKSIKKNQIEIPTQSKDLKEALACYLQDRFELKRDPTHMGVAGITIMAQRAAFDIYLRVLMEPLYSWPASTIVIARIGFKKTFTGQGKDLVEFLRMEGRRLGFKYIGIEQANEGCQIFGRKLGFHKHTNPKTLLRLIDP